MKGKLAILWTLALVGMATQVSAQQLDDQMFSAPPNRQSLGGGMANDAERSGPLTLELSDNMIEKLRANEALQAPIDTRDAPFVNQIVFGFSGPLERLEQDRSFGLIDPISKSNGVLVFEFRDSDLLKIRNSTLRYQLNQEELGRYNSVEIVYRGSTRDHSNSPIRPDENSDSSMETAPRVSQDDRFNSGRGMNERVINPPSNQDSIADLGQRGTRDRAESGLSRPPAVVDRDDFRPTRPDDRPNSRLSDQQDARQPSVPAWQRDLNLPDFGSGTDSGSREAGSREAGSRRGAAMDTARNDGRDRESRESASGLQSPRSDQWDLLERKMDAIERLRRELLADKRDLDLEQVRFAQQQEQWLRNRDSSSERVGTASNAPRASSSQAEDYEDTLATLKRRLDSIERQNRRLQDENRDLLVDLNRFESDDRSYATYNRDRWSNRVEPRPTNRQGLESLQASLPGTNRLVDNRDPSADGRSKRDIGILFSLLIGSLALNLYLAWISRGFYVRYSELADELRETFASSV